MSSAPVPLSWSRSDIEQQLFFRGARFTRVNGMLSLILGTLMALAFYGVLVLIPQTYIAQMFLKRGFIPYTIVFFTGWSVAILLIKSLKLRLQRRAIEFVPLPSDPSFVLTPATVDEVLNRIYQIVDDPRHFMLFNRILVTLANLRNLGRVSDVDELLRSQAENDEAVVDTSYHLLQGFVWAIPVLGFIGTVLGLSQAIGGFGAVLAQTADASQLKPALQQVTAGLAVAFETTLQGLVAALCIQLWLTTLRVAEEHFLDDCGEYCLRHIVGRLRLLPYEAAEAHP